MPVLHRSGKNLLSLLTTEVKDLLGNSALTLLRWEQCFFPLLFPQIIPWLRVEREGICLRQFCQLYLWFLRCEL